MNTAVDAVRFPARRFDRISASSCKLKLLNSESNVVSLGRLNFAVRRNFSG